MVDGLIEFKEQLLSNVISCTTFTANYPLLIEHIIREAKLYRSYILALLNGDNIDNSNLKQTELFWNQIMMEHALFIRGLLDPTEQELINTSDEFAKIYQNLLIDVQNATDATMKNITNTTLQETLKYRNFKIAGTKGITTCEIKSIILPPLGDHVLREANHYIRLLNNQNK